MAGPEAANNAACAGGLVPLLALGLPFAPPTAILLSGLMIHGVTPGPLLIQNHPEIFWGVIGSMYLGNIFLVILNLPLVGVFASITKVSPKYLMPAILLLCVIGAYGENNSIFDVWVMLAFGFAGYILRKYDFEPAPLILGLVLGRILESNLRQSLLITGGSILGLWQRPITAVILSIAVIAIVAPVIIKYAFRKEVTGFVQQE
ncbi:tripartite tricarboxylate transporter TctA family protein [Moorella mulderi DSM 14980]|uniref:Tripartite tricarboxylate transporter TctA family protein n=1 Tax=Moorella mulderi DSM 14980 TaxID=1122241 RepID=A0A151AUF0_9FIRM|nr:tripartite tricarboxylate transporter TctA family protein [Moorella mulderi DSM 14980]